MGNENKHIIIKEIFEVYLPSTADGFTIQQKLGPAFIEQLNKAVEKLLDTYCPNEKVIQFNTINIDLGWLSLKGLENNLISKIIDALEVEIKEDLHRATETFNGKPKKFSESSIGEHIFERWLNYLKKGILEIYSIQITENSTQLEILSLLATDNQAQSKFRKLLSENPVALKRLILQYQNKFLKSILETMLATKQDYSFKVSEAFGNIQKKVELFTEQPNFINLTIIRNYFWHWLFNLTLNNSNINAKKQPSKFLSEYFTPTELVFLNRILQQPAINNTKEFQLIKKSLGEIVPKQFKKNKPQNSKPGNRIGNEQNKPLIIAESEDFNERNNSIDINLSDTNTKVDRQNNEQNSNGNSPGNQVRTTSENNSWQESRQRTNSLFSDYSKNNNTEKSMSNSDEKHSDVIFIKNAGIALLHPFLKNFFNTLQIIEGIEFKDEAARIKAIHLIQYLASGSFETPEYELTLPKLLCGLPIELPIDRFIEITEKEKAESDILLKAVINNWGALGNTSPEGLREGFLQRNGKLEKRQQGWYLVVEQKSIDILIQKLPWGFGIIKLPWMVDLLHVEWT